MAKFFLLVVVLAFGSADNFAADPAAKPSSQPSNTTIPPVKPEAKPAAPQPQPPSAVPYGTLKSPAVGEIKITSPVPPASPVNVVNESTVLAQADKMQKVFTDATSGIQDMLLMSLIGTSIACTVIILGFLYYFARSIGSSSKVQPQDGPSSSDINRFIESVNSFKSALGSSIKNHQSNSDNKVKPTPTLDEILNKFLPKVAAEAVKALQDSEVGRLNDLITKQDADLQGLRHANDTLSRQVQPLEDEVTRVKAERDKVVDERASLDGQNMRLSGQLTEALLSVDNVRKEAETERLNAQRLLAESEAHARNLSSIQAEVSKLSTELESERASLVSVRDELKHAREEIRSQGEKSIRAYESLVPSKLHVTELSSQIEVVHREAIIGDAPAISAWSALSSFGAAQQDPLAKDFQLQIVRRLGVVLVQYWKQRGLSEKERHEHLSLWAKHLNEHAEGRYNLFVPGLGAPIDKTRMVSASGGATVHEVLCWQIRNPSGANFMLAEVA
jgi:septal ring factor EnvC (AmiA/AmiB activator)